MFGSLLRKANIPTPSSVLADLIVLKVGGLSLDSDAICPHYGGVKCEVQVNSGLSIIIEFSHAVEYDRETMRVECHRDGQKQIVTFARPDYKKIRSAVRAAGDRKEAWDKNHTAAENEHLALDILGSMI